MTALLTDGLDSYTSDVLNKCKQTHWKRCHVSPAITSLTVR